MSVAELQEQLDQARAAAAAYPPDPEKPMPGENHSAIQANLVVEFAKDRRYRVHSEPTLDIPGEPSIPDLSVYLRKPTPLNLERERSRLSEPPLLTVEISSPSQGLGELYSKADLYFGFGVRSCWIVITQAGLIHVLTADGYDERFISGTVTDPITGLTADLGAVFS